MKNQFAEEFERSEKETNLIENFYRAKANEVLRVYDEKVADFIQNKPSTDELVSFLSKLKDSLLTIYKDSVVVGKLALNFEFKLLNPNENHVKNEIKVQLYQRMNEKYSNENQIRKFHEHDLLIILWSLYSACRTLVYIWNY